ncbi:thioesterase family protein [Pseudomonas silvicola]|nr:thioesterase family protein [Pseudomonas silvicola]
MHLTTPLEPQSFADLMQLDLVDGAYQGRYGLANLTGNVFGGQLMAQALSCIVTATPEERALRSLHASFLRPHPLTRCPRFSTQLLLQGKQFSNWDVRVLNEGQPCLSVSLCLQGPAESPVHGGRAPQVVPAEQLVNLTDLASELASRLSTGAARLLRTPQLYDLRPVDAQAFLFCEGQPNRVRYWMRSRLPLGEDARAHEAALIYMSDAWTNSPMLLPHIETRLTRAVFAPTLSHSLWLHQRTRADDWLLFDLHCPALNGGAGLITGAIYTRAGDLVANLAQHALYRSVPAS